MLCRYSKRIYASYLEIGSIFSLCHCGVIHDRIGQIYMCADKIKSGAFTVIRAKPVRGRNQDIRFISGERFVFIESNLPKRPYNKKKHIK